MVMSRIEEALKKVSGQRKAPREERVFVPGKQHAEPKLKNPINLLLDVVPLKISNLLLATAHEEKTNVVEEFNKLRSSVIALTKVNVF